MGITGCGAKAGTAKKEDCGVYKIEGSAADNQAVRLVGEAGGRGVGARATWRRPVRAEPGVEPPRDPSPQALHGSLDETVAGSPAARRQGRERTTAARSNCIGTKLLGQFCVRGNTLPS